MTDADYQELIFSYYSDGNRSEEAVEAVGCSRARQALKTVVQGLGARREGLGGAQEDAIRTAIADAYPTANTDYLDSLWEGCPGGGRYIVSLEPAKPLHDGTKMWEVEVYCDVHTPDAYASHEEALPQ